MLAGDTRQQPGDGYHRVLPEISVAVQLNVASPLPAGLSAAPERRRDVMRVSGSGTRSDSLRQRNGAGVIRCGISSDSLRD